MLQRLVVALAILLLPIQLGWAGQGALSVDAISAMTVDHAAMTGPDGAVKPLMPAECCEDGNHQNAACHGVPALPDRIAASQQPLPLRENHPRPARILARGSGPEQPLRPPIPT
ncbi:MAG: hypothetical protein ACK5LJ_06355 [Paracoccus sp. (in: a-proteobacteria)]